ncbi:MAG: acetyl-CoA C-acyltransferase, partial [Rhodocyclaceae bacterium]|nr:acetyl-CoA C-acyltransferase [Rhodocyclaceae bacterium]
KIMGIGPVPAVRKLSAKSGDAVGDYGLVELNEAFAAQVIACLKAWQDDAYCREALGLEGPLGVLDEGRLNVDGGAIAQGHPVGASGARIVLHLLQVLERTGGQRGIAAICIGGGQGGAMLLERC